MAVDRKGDYVGNHGGAYTDNDGMSRQFTYIDHDKKPKIATGSLSSEELEDVKDRLKKARQDTIDRILALPASLCPWSFTDYTIRNENTTTILWNEVMLRDEGVSTKTLGDILTIVENRIELNSQGLL